MGILPYLPSSRFTILVCALALAIGLVWGTERFVHPPQSYTGSLQSATASTTNSDWPQSLDAVAAVPPPDNSSITDNAAQLIAAGSSGNLTDTVGRALFVNTSAATGQGLGADPAEQQQVLDSAMAQLQAEQPTAAAYTAADLTVVPDSQANLHDYGNALIALLFKYPQTFYANVMKPVAATVDTNDASQLAPLQGSAAKFRLVAKGIVALRTPASLATEAVSLANGYLAMAQACDDMQQTISDPLRGLLGVQNFNTTLQSNEKVFTQIAGEFQKNAILFSKSDPGAQWNVLLSVSAQ